jgi:hypothetical protein
MIIMNFQVIVIIKTLKLYYQYQLNKNVAKKQKYQY